VRKISRVDVDVHAPPAVAGAGTISPAISVAVHAPAARAVARAGGASVVIEPLFIVAVGNTVLTQPAESVFQSAGDYDDCVADGMQFVLVVVVLAIGWKLMARAVRVNA
jgi:hypothetical protein